MLRKYAEGEFSDEDMPDDFTEDVQSSDSAIGIRDKLFNAVEEASPVIVKGLAKHNLEQYWWKKLSIGETLRPEFYSSSLTYINNAASEKSEDIARKIKDSIRVEGSSFVYSFPFDSADFLGEFTVAFPENISLEVSQVRDLDESKLKHVIIQEYAKWLGTHILFEGI